MIEYKDKLTKNYKPVVYKSEKEVLNNINVSTFKFKRPGNEDDFNYQYSIFKHFKTNYLKSQICKYFIRGICPYYTNSKECQFAHSIKEINKQNYLKLIKDYENVKNTINLSCNYSKGYFILKPEYIVLIDYKNKYNLNITEDSINNDSGARSNIRKIIIKELFKDFMSFLLKDVLNSNYVLIDDLENIYIPAIGVNFKINLSFDLVYSKAALLKDLISNDNNSTNNINNQKYNNDVFKDKLVIYVKLIPCLEHLYEYFKNVIINSISNIIDNYNDNLKNEFENIELNKNKNNSNNNNTSLKNLNNDTKYKLLPNHTNNNNNKNEKFNKKLKDNKTKVIKEYKNKQMHLSIESNPNNIIPLNSKFIKSLIIKYSSNLMPDIYKSLFTLMKINENEYLQILSNDSMFINNLSKLFKDNNIGLKYFSSKNINDLISIFDVNNYIDEGNNIMNKDINLNIENNNKSYIINIVYSLDYLIDNYFKLYKDYCINYKISNCTINFNIITYVLFNNKVIFFSDNNNNNHICFISKLINIYNKLDCIEILELSYDLQINKIKNTNNNIKEDLNKLIVCNQKNKLANYIKDILNYEIINLNKDNNNINNNLLIKTEIQKFLYNILIVNDYDTIIQMAEDVSKFEYIGVDIEGSLYSKFNFYEYINSLNNPSKKEKYIKINPLTINLIQIYNKINNTVYLIDVYTLAYLNSDNVIYEALKSLLTFIFQSSNIIKIMHDCRGDILALKRMFNIYAVSVIDLSCMYLFLKQGQMQIDFKNRLFKYNNKQVLESYIKSLLDKNYKYNFNKIELSNNSKANTIVKFSELTKLIEENLIIPLNINKPGLNKVLSEFNYDINKQNIKVNYLKEKVGKLFKDKDFQKNSIFKRPIDLNSEWFNYSVMDCLYLENSYKNIKNQISELIFNDNIETKNTLKQDSLIFYLVLNISLSHLKE